MTITAFLEYKDMKVLEAIAYLSWARIYENGADVTETLTYIQLLGQLRQPMRRSARAGRSRGH